MHTMCAAAAALSRVTLSNVGVDVWCLKNSAIFWGP